MCAWTISKDEIRERRDRIAPYLRRKLLPFWLNNSVDRKYGGFLTYFDRNGKPTGVTDKTLVQQTRMIFTMASAHRYGLGDGQCARLAEEGAEFLVKHFWDRQYGGWYWICAQDGTPIDDSKIIYGHDFAMYCLSELALATGSELAREYALKTYDELARNVIDTRYGGYYEMLHRDWSIKPGGVYGGDRKSLDVHMHMMEALTVLYELTRSHVHRRRLLETIDLLNTKMLFPKFGTGIAQFSHAFEPLRAILFKNVWGSDRDAEEDEGRPLNNTNYGHNIEYAWLLNHASKILGEHSGDYTEVIRRLIDHAIQWGIDWEYGGIYVEGPNDGPATQTLKEFWQQAEALVGLLDGCLLFKDDKYWKAFVNVHDFVWNHVINHDVGEWYALCERDGRVKWDYLGHAWKISYHTVRSTIQTERRLNMLLGEA